MLQSNDSISCSSFCFNKFAIFLYFLYLFGMKVGIGDASGGLFAYKR